MNKKFVYQVGNNKKVVRSSICVYLIILLTLKYNFDTTYDVIYKNYLK